MPISIFYSWQSDLPNTLNRGLIRRALDDAVGKINADLAVEDAIRIDQDTQDVPGSPAITDTILRKIEECDVFMPDVTFVVGSDEERPSPNPNVMIEYGYALKVCGDQRIIPIFNMAFGDCEKLPFDMRHKRRPRLYEASEGLDEEGRREARRQLSVRLERELRGMHESGLFEADREVAPPPSFEPMPAKDGLGGSFLEPDEAVGITRSLRGIGGEDQHLKLHNGSLIYMRLWPHTPTTEFSNTEVKDVIQAAQLRPMCSLQGTGWSYGRNKYGAFCFETMGDEGQVTGLTQLFKNGEIWGIDTYYLNTERRDGRKFIPTTAVEKDLKYTLGNYLQAAREHLELPLPLELRVGMTRVEGYMLAVPQAWHMGGYAGNIFSPSFEHAAHVDSYDVEPAELLLPFFEKMYDEAGQVRPQTQDGG